VLSFAFMFLSFWEPANRHDIDFYYDNSMKYIELSILFFYTLDLLLTIIHLGHDVDRSFKYLSQLIIDAISSLIKSL